MANEQESLDRSEEVRNRLRREAAKRGYLNQPTDAIQQTSSNQRVPTVAEIKVSNEPSTTESKEE